MSGYKKVNGQVYLTADTGTVANTGTINVSATVAGGHGGSVLLSSKQGAVVNTGEIDAKGGTGGSGGDVEVSGATVDAAAAS